MCVLMCTVGSFNHLLLLLSPFLDSEGCLHVAARHSSSHPVGQCCVHRVSNCSQGAQLFSQSEAASAHPSGARHSELIRGCSLASLCVITSVLCAAADVAALKKNKQVEQLNQQ